MTIIFEEAVLTADDEQRLARDIEVGLFAQEALDRGEPPRGASLLELGVLAREGQRAHQRLVEANFRLVAQAAYRVAHRSGLDADDLFQDGVVGLLEAVRRYDHRRGARFATFALPWIRLRVMESAVTRCGELGLPPSRARRWVQVISVRDMLVAESGREPSPAEIAERLDLSAGQVDKLLGFAGPAHLDGHPEVGIDEEGALSSVDLFGLRRLLRRLTGEERGVLERLYGLAPYATMSYAEVAAELGISASTVRRREQAALHRLRGEPEASAVA